MYVYCIIDIDTVVYSCVCVCVCVCSWQVSSGPILESVSWSSILLIISQSSPDMMNMYVCVV